MPSAKTKKTPLKKTTLKDHRLKVEDMIKSLANTKENWKKKYQEEDKVQMVLAFEFTGTCFHNEHNNNNNDDDDVDDDDETMILLIVLIMMMNTLTDESLFLLWYGNIVVKLIIIRGNPNSKLI